MLPVPLLNEGFHSCSAAGDLPVLLEVIVVSYACKEMHRSVVPLKYTFTILRGVRCSDAVQYNRS
jgi:hypothetical protein